MAIKKIMLPVLIAEKIRYEFNYTNAERAAMVLHDSGVTSEDVNNLEDICSIMKNQTFNALRDIEKGIIK